MTALPAHLQPCLKQIDAHAVISFDIFDTVLLRPVAVPCHLFWLMEKEAQHILEDPLCEFQKMRVEAEALARKRAPQAEDITLDQIYDAFRDMAYLEADKAEAIKQKELELERKHCFAHPDVTLLYHHALASGKEVIFTSDMYLPSAFIRELLEKNGFYTKPHRIFLSSELLKTKHSGTVYPYIAQTLQRKPAEILHIGDNKIADIKHAKRAGFSAFHIPRNTDQFFAKKRHRQIWGMPEYIDDIESSLVIGQLANYYGTGSYAHQDNHKEPLTANWYEFGYHVVGMLYLGYTQWLMKALKSEKMDAVYFLSRDGKIMKEAFDLIAPFYGEARSSSYIYASRRALQIARIRKIDSLALMYISTSSAALPVSEYLERIGMNPDDHIEAMQQLGFSGKNYIIDSPEDRRKIQQFFRLIEPDVLKYAEKERQSALSYYHSHGLGDDTKRHALVDIGWGAMMLYALNDMLGKAPGHIHGFYLGTTPLAKKIADQGFSIHGYLFNKGEPHEYASAAYQCLEIVELLFSATHGSLKCFAEQNGESLPVLDEVDCSPERIEAIEALQRGAFDFIRDAMPLFSQYPHIALSPNVAMRPLRAILNCPTRSEVAMFSFLTHVQDISATQCDRMIVDMPPSLLHLAFKPFSFAGIYKRVYWKRGFETLMGRLPRLYLRFLLRTYIFLLSTPMLAKAKRMVNRLLRV